MQIISLEINDILSIKNASIFFEERGLVLVEGFNYDTNRANGAGKTAIFNCISFALYDKMPRKITASEILRRGCTNGFVKVTVRCGEDIWAVQRSRPKGVQFEKNGQLMNITQVEFEKALRLSYEQFLITCYNPQANSKHFGRFLGAGDSDKKKFILALLGLEEFSQCKETIDDSVDEISSQLEKVKQQINNELTKMTAYNESLLDETPIDSELVSLDLAIEKLRKEIVELATIQKPDLTKYSKLEDDIRIKMTEISHARAKLSVLHSQFRELKASQHDYDSNQKCSECGSSMDNEEARKAHRLLQDKIVLKLKDIKDQIDIHDAIVAKENSLNELSKKIRDKKNDDSTEYHSANIRMNELKALVRNKELQKEMLLSKLKTNADLIRKIGVINNSINNLSMSVKSDNEQLMIDKLVSAIFAPTGAQAYVLDSIVDSFNEIVTPYIDILSPNLTYSLNSYKEKVKGEAIAKFSETITKNGVEVSVGSLSGGEEKGLSLCVDFALIGVLETQFGMRLNPIILDEPFDGLDLKGRELIIALLEQLALNRNIFVVDHMTESKTMFSKSIFVALRNDISTITYNT